MGLLRTIQVALAALIRNKLRSFLTVLGVVIGVAAVIAMVSIGEGAKARVAKNFESMGTNMLLLRSGSAKSRGVRGGAGSQPTLTWTDLEAVSQLPAVRYASPMLNASAQVASSEQNWGTSVAGVSADYFDIRNWPLSAGRRFSAAELRSKAKVAIIGSTIVTNLWGEGADPIGETIRIQNIPFEVIGVTTSKGTSMRGGDNDDVVHVPYTTFQAKIKGGLRRFIAGSVYVSAVAPDATHEAQSQIETLLRNTHRLGSRKDDFRVRNLADLAQASQDSANTISSLLAGVALVSLLVGGIGIMNIMLVSVTERTREVGLRMAIGARPRQILAQFLLEAVTLALIGGFLGIVSGIAMATYLAGQFQFPLLVRVDIVALAVAFSGVVGVVFGLYPARKASLLDPIQALRYE
jgi:putative ABC transport system permease protein